MEMDTMFRQANACPCAFCQLNMEHCSGCDSYNEWFMRRTNSLRPANTAQCNFQNICSSGRANVKMAGFGGHLLNQWDSDKWENPWCNRTQERSWKAHRSTQYRA